VRHGALSVIEERMPPHTAETRHAHGNARQFFYVLAGIATFEIDGHEVTLAARQGIEVPPATPHQIRNDADTPLEFLVVSTPPSHGDRYSVLPLNAV
jgi:mannose-6-phosphate isomerase-like protein (cupin superfamily)